MVLVDLFSLSLSLFYLFLSTNNIGYIVMIKYVWIWVTMDVISIVILNVLYTFYKMLIYNGIEKIYTYIVLLRLILNILKIHN